MQWRHVADITVPREIIGMAASPAGYVVISWPRTAWFSTDGRSWASTDLPFRAATSMNVEFQLLDDGTELEATVNAVAGGPKGFLVVGSYTRPPCNGQFTPGGSPRCEIGPISWVSEDGRTWRSSITTPIPVEGEALPRYSEFARAWPAADGWDVAVSVLRDTPVSRGNTLLHAQDGLTWARLEPAPLPDGASSGDDVYRHGGVASPDGRRLSWQVTDKGLPTATTLSMSADGITWTRLAGFDGARAFVILGIGPEQGGGEWLLGGYLIAGETSTVRWWRSGDLATWTSGELPIAWQNGRGLRAFERWAGQYVALGARDEPCCVANPGTWLSSDGRTWSEAEGNESPTYMAVGPAGLVGVATGEKGSARIWLGLGLVP